MADIINAALIAVCDQVGEAVESLSITIMDMEYLDGRPHIDGEHILPTTIHALSTALHRMRDLCEEANLEHGL